MRKRNLILFGAGAAIPWGGPSTSDVTKMLINKEDKIRVVDSNFIRLIHNFLLFKYSHRDGYYEEFINFEDIISTIEEIILYFSDTQKISREHISSIYRLSFELEDEMKKFYINETKKDFFLQILQDVLNSIRLRVHEYSKHYSENDSNIFPSGNSELEEKYAEERKKLNYYFKEWSFKLSDDNSIIRSYTLNYDRLFIELFKWSLNTEIFEGISKLENERKEFDLNAILKNRENHCHYNLHGSVYWCLQNRNSLGYDDWVFTLNIYPDWESNAQNLPKITIDQGRSFLLSNIIAGYNKSIRTFISPFKQFHISFEMDCSDADNIYLIGYSFSDQHINASIRTHFLANENSVIHIIDPKFKDKDRKSIYRILNDWFPPMLDTQILMNLNSSTEAYPYSMYSGRVRVYPQSFEDYLNQFSQ